MTLDSGFIDYSFNIYDMSPFTYCTESYGHLMFTKTKKLA